MIFDQAQKLRELAEQRGPDSPPCGMSVPLVAISGGKGGVGASTVALRLATSLRRRGYQSLLLEADLDRGGFVGEGDRGGSIVDCLSGQRTLMDVCRTGPDGTLIVPGAWAPWNVADCTALAQQRLLAELQRPMPEVDVAVVDLGSSRNSFVRRFWQVASMVIAVTTADAECVTDTYAAIKLLHAGDTSIPVYTLVNRADPSCDPHTIHDRIGQTCKRFLGLRTSILGSLPRLDDLADDDAVTLIGQVSETLATELGLIARTDPSLRTWKSPETQTQRRTNSDHQIC